MKRSSESRRTNLDPNPRREFWYSVLTMFPFAFIPLIALVGVFAGLVMPYLNGGYSR